MTLMYVIYDVRYPFFLAHPVQLIHIAFDEIALVHRVLLVYMIIKQNEITDLVDVSNI